MELSEKAESKAQQRLMGAVLNAKRTGKASTPEVAKLALTMKTSDVKDFASTKHKGLPEKKKIDEDKSFGEFRLTLKTHKELNPKIWTDKKLDPEIATNLVKIGKEWAKFAEIPEDVIKDYIIVGGNANFNYTKYSDIDLHLVVDKKKLGCEGCLDDFLRAKKQLWALTHNITIKGHPVELYAQDIDEKVGSKGQYSLKQKKWTHEPTPYKLNRKDPEVVKKVKDLIYQIDSLIDAKSDDKVVFQNLKDKIGTMRKAAIQKSGEYAPENLVFKELRNRGYVEKVWNYLRDLGDKELSVEEVQLDEKFEETKWTASILLPSKRRRKVTITSPSRDRKDAIQIIKALYGTDDIKQLNRVGIRTEGVMDIVRKHYKKKEKKKPQRATDAGARARRKLQRREYKDKVSSIVPAELENQKDWDGFKNLIG